MKKAGDKLVRINILGPVVQKISQFSSLNMSKTINATTPQKMQYMKYGLCTKFQPKEIHY